MCCTTTGQLGEPGFAYSYSVLYDRRRLEEFLKFDVPRFQHVTSCKTKAPAYNMLHGRLCHLLRVIMDQNCFILEVARCIHYMRRCGYDVSVCFTHTKRFLVKHARGAYRMPHQLLYSTIQSVYTAIAMDDALITGCADEWQPTHHSIVMPLYPRCPSDMDISDDDG